MHPFADSLSDSLMQSFRHSLPHSFTYSLTNSPNHSPTRSFTKSYTQALIHPSTYSLTHSLASPLRRLRRCERCARQLCKRREPGWRTRARPGPGHQLGAVRLLHVFGRVPPQFVPGRRGHGDLRHLALLQTRYAGDSIPNPSSKNPNHALRLFGREPAVGGLYCTM